MLVRWNGIVHGKKFVYLIKMYFSGKVLKYYYTVSECLEHIKIGNTVHMSVKLSMFSDFLRSFREINE